jgi:hypothetical protein
MTLIVAWRDPFCLLSDGMQTTPAMQIQSRSGWKIAHIPGSSLALGLAGPATATTLNMVVREVQQHVLPAAQWDDLCDAARMTVDSINDRPEFVSTQPLTVVIADTIAGVIGIFDSAARAGIAEPRASDRQFAFAGSGGLHAHITKVIASRFCPKVTGEELLITIIEAAIRTDHANSGNPIWRIDLGGGEIKPAYEWLCVLPEAPASPRM